MKISVITPTYNSAKYILEAIDSVLAQTHAPAEIIVVDDGSKDNTRTILDSYIKSGKIKYFYQNNSGPGAARNMAISRASGELIAFLDADDIWEPDKLERQAKFFTDSQIGIVYSDMKFIGSKFKFKYFSEIEPEFHRGHIFEELIQANFIATSTTVIRKSFFDSVRGFKENISIGEDYDLWLRMGMTCKADFVPRALVQYRIHSEQVSRSAYKTHKEAQKIYKDLLMNPKLTDAQKKLVRHELYRAKAKAAYRLFFRGHGVEA